jgi:hypothetical protein
MKIFNWSENQVHEKWQVSALVVLKSLDAITRKSA